MASAVLTEPPTAANAAGEPHKDPEQDAEPADDRHTPEASPGLPRGDVLSTVAHEIRGPLTSLMTSAEILQQDFDSLPAEQKREIVSSMHRGALWLHALVENLLCDATIREGRFQIHRQRVPFADIVAEVEPIVTPLLLRGRQRLDIHSEQPSQLVHADPRRIGQVLVNLLSNAARYGREGSPIELTVSAVARSVFVAVADRGPGLRSGDMNRVFEPFYRAGAADHSGQPGAGLGLSIVKFIVEAHGGQIGAFNRDGGGACFWFELPSADANEIGSGGRR